MDSGKNRFSFVFHSKSESHIAYHNDKSFVYFKVISKVEWITKKSADFRFHWSKSGPVYMLKLVDFLVIETNVFNESSSIFCKSYFYSIKCLSHYSKKDSMKNGQFQWVQESYCLTEIWILWELVQMKNLKHFVSAFCFKC